MTPPDATATASEPSALVCRTFALAGEGGDRRAIVFKGRAISRDELWASASRIADELAAASVGLGTPVGWLARNSPEMIAALLALVASGRPVCVVNPHEAPGLIASRLRELRFAAVVGVAADWHAEVGAAVREAGGIGLEIDLSAAAPVRRLDETPGPAAAEHRLLPPDTVLELITSGTTGDPKRIPISAAKFLKGIAFGTRREAGSAAAPATPAREKSPNLLSAPFSHASGVFHTLLALKEGRPIVLRERFRVADWLDDMRAFRPKVANLVPAAIAMVLASEATREDLSSLIVVRSGTAPLDPRTRDAFEDRFGVPILHEYGASEFIGGITVWTLADYAAFKEAKRGSVGRLKPDVEARILDRESEAVLQPGEIGVLSVRSARIGPDWVRTTDLASIDVDGFLFIHGRADQAINRGGFKILPDAVTQVLRRHPAVRDVAVIAARDPVLGQVPLAAVEFRGEPDVASLRAFAQANLAPYQVPVAFEPVATLPRTSSLKIALAELRAQLAGRYVF